MRGLRLAGRPGVMTKMKTTMTALAVLMLAAAAPAAAQDRGGDNDRPRFERGGDRQGGGGRRPDGPRRPPEARRAPDAVQAPQAPRPPEARGERRGGGDNDRPRFERGGDRRFEGRVGRPGGWVDDDGQPSSDADRFDREDRNEARQWRRYNQGQPPVGQPGVAPRQPRQDGDRDWRREGRDGRDGRDWNRDGDRRGEGDRRWDRDGDRRWDGRDGDRRWGRDGDRRGWDGRWDRNDRDRWDRHDRDRDRRRGDRPMWRPGLHPFSYHSRQRFRAGVWIAPPGYYARSWGYGDYLPFGWYGDSYRLTNWWAYGLPWPPVGYDWVRVGPDALLVDRWSGQVVQVVRMLFW